jgi:hypothetical protein
MTEILWKKKRKENKKTENKQEKKQKTKRQENEGAVRSRNLFVLEVIVGQKRTHFSDDSLSASVGGG